MKNTSTALMILVALAVAPSSGWVQSVRHELLGHSGSTLIDESLRLKSPSELASIFGAAGVESGDTVVASCHIGQYATTVRFAARTLGYDVLLYDGAIQDWAQRDLPVEASAGGNP